MGNVFLNLCGRGSFEEKQDTPFKSLERTAMKRNKNTSSDLSNIHPTCSKRSKIFQDAESVSRQELADAERLCNNFKNNECTTSSISCDGGGDASGINSSKNIYNHNSKGNKTNITSHENVLANHVTNENTNTAQTQNLLTHTQSNESNENVDVEFDSNESDDERNLLMNAVSDESSEQTDTENVVANVVTNETNTASSENVATNVVINEIVKAANSENGLTNFGSNESVSETNDENLACMVEKEIGYEPTSESLVTNIASCLNGENSVANIVADEGHCSNLLTNTLFNESSFETNKAANAITVESDNEANHIDSEDAYLIKHINELPSSLLVHIFQYLNLYDTLHRVSLVCKLWHNLCCDPDIWRKIDLNGQLKVDDPLILRLTSYSGNVVSLDLTDVRLTTNEGMVSTLKQCPQLRSLSLVRCMHLTDYAFQAIGEYCHQLVNLKLDCCAALTDQSVIKIGIGCPKLEKVWLNQCSGLTDIGCTEFVKRCPKLQLLTLEQCRQLTDCFLGSLTDNCPHMKDLKFMSNDFTTDGLQQLSKLKELENLEITQISTLSDDNVMHIVRNCPKLYILNVSLCSNVTDKSVAYLAKTAKNIKSLYLVACKLTDNALFSLADHCHNIEKVDVGWCTEITDAGAIMISEKCQRLQYLGLMRCDRVTREACQTLVERFPKVNYSTMWLECERLLARARSAGYCTL